MARVLFHRVVQDAPEFGSTETRAVSRVFFDLEGGGERHPDLYAEVVEAVGSSHRDEEMTVRVPDELPVDRKALEEAVREYYRGLVSSAGFGKHLAKDKGFRTQNNNLPLTQVVEL